MSRCTHRQTARLTCCPQVQEISIDYSDCQKLAPYDNSTSTGFEPIPGDKLSRSFKAATCPDNGVAQWKRMNTTHTYGNFTVQDQPMCSIQFTIPHELHPPVFLYYRLTNFYQNHRRYVKSLDMKQLKGDAVPAGTIANSDCEPLKLDPQGRPYYPCGLIANSLFNDTFNQPLLLNLQSRNQMNQTYNMTNEGIAWDSDKALYGQTKYRPEDIAVPPYWRKRYPEETYSEDHPPPNLEVYEEFHVWMRTAGLPAFSKLALRNDEEKMACGTYQLDIVDSTWLGRIAWMSLKHTRFQCNHLRRYQVHPPFYENRHGRQKSLSGYRIYCCWRHLYRSWRAVHSHSSDQATVGYAKRCERIPAKRASQETRRPHLPHVEQ